ncbi:hypothetical protein D3C75_1250930 [compost metagenome]
MIIRQLDQNCRRDIYISAFIITVDSLAALQIFGHLCLRHIFVFTQITDSLIHLMHLQSKHILANYSLLIFSEKFAKMIEKASCDDS